MLPLSYPIELWYNGDMKNTHNTVKTASKDILAKCMATEDINVEHRADVPTAYFDTKNRTLCLPVWKDMDNSVYDMLVGHEVSHALHTPQTGWEDFVGDGKGSQIRHMFLNIVEDARIERMIKDKFPGIRRDFASAYKTLHTQDMFELNNRTLGLDLPLIDRLNLHFKLGLFGLETIPFATDEKQFVTRMAETVTFEDVVKLAQDLYGKHQDELEDEESQSQSQSQSGEGEAGDGEGQSGSEDWQDAMNEDGESQSQSGEGDTETTESTEGAGEQDADAQEGDDSGQSLEDDTDDGESAESESGSEDGSESGDGESQESQDSPDSLDYDDYKNNTDAAGGTQKAMEQNVNELRDENAKNPTYRTLPNMKIDDIVVDFKTVESIFTKHQSETELSDRQTVTKTEELGNLKSFLNDSKGVVNHMVQQFQMKQAADADKRTSIAKTGVLDTVNMINYRWSEDVFRKNEVIADGKSHGMIMYLDWSGSMNGILQDTICQLLILTEFCNKVNIPFEVHAFSSNQYCPQLEGLDRWSDEYKDVIKSMEDERGEQFVKLNEETDITPHKVQLYNFLSSRMNTKQYKTATKNLWMLAYAEQSYSYPHPSCLGTGCTPLNEAILCALDMVPAFQQANQLQIVNTVFLTDGEGHGIGLVDSWGENRTILRDHKTRKTYNQPTSQSNRRSVETDMLLNLLRERTGTSLIGIRLQTHKSMKGHRWHYDFKNDESFNKACEDYKNNNFCVVPSAYDLYFVVQGHMTVQTDALADLNENASIAKIKNAFIKGSNNKKSSRVISTKMVEVFAVA